MSTSSTANKLRAASLETMRIGATGIPAPTQTPVPARFGIRIRGYDLLEEVGVGGMGIVYKARHRELNRIVALKMLKTAEMTDAESRLRFRAEAESVARLQNPNIIQVFEVGEQDGAPFIALEFVDGGSLTQRTAHPQSPRVAAELVEKLARAVHSAHELGVVHRDLKPANVLLTRSGEPKIADFGLAKQIEHERDSSGGFVTQAGTVVGTPEYMPPEQTSGHPAAPPIDIYALGVILYELLTSSVPFRGATPFDTMTLVHDQEAVPPRRLQPALPRDLETICLKCLEKAPSRRYATALHLADDLRRFLDGRTILARRASSVERSVRWVRRNPVVATLLAAIAAVICIAFLVVSRSNLQLEEALRNEAGLRLDAQSNAEEARKNAEEARKNAEAERFEAYRAHLMAAASLFDSHDIGAKRNLEACTDRQGWEWRHFNSRLDLAERFIEPQTRERPYILMSRNGEQVILSTPTRFRILDTASGRWSEKSRPTPTTNLPVMSNDGRWSVCHVNPEFVELHNLETDRVTRFPRNGEADSMRFNGDGLRLLTAAPGRTVRVRECETGKVLLEFHPYRGGVGTAGYSPDGRRIVTSSRDELRVDLWDAETGRHIAPLTCGATGLQHVYFGRTRFITEEHFPQTILKLWDLETGLFLGEMRGHENMICYTSFSPDDTRVVTASMDQSACLWDASTGKLIKALTGHTGWVNVTKFSPDGERLLTASQDHTLRIWNARTGERINVLSGHDEEVFRADYSADGSQIVSVSCDAITRFWDTKRMERDSVLRGHKSFVYGVAVHPDGRHVASAAWDGTARIWGLDEEREMAKLDHGEKAVVLSVAFHPGKKLLASRTIEAVHLWDLDTRREVHRWDAPSDRYRHTRLAFSPDGKLLATGGTECRVHVWDVESRAEHAVLRGHTDVVRDVAFSPDSKHLASAGEYTDKTIRIWSLAEKREVHVLRGHTSTIYCLTFSPDGMLASGSMDDSVRLWNIDDGSNLAELKHGSHIYSLTFTPDGKRLAAGCANNAIRIWDTEKWKEVVDLRGHTRYVHSVAFSSDGTRLVSGSGDTTLRIWNTKRPGK